MMLLRGRREGRTTFRRRKRARLALIKADNYHRVQQGAYLTDGRDTYEVLERQDRSFGNGIWVRLQNTKFPGKTQWFRLEDVQELAVIL